MVRSVRTLEGVSVPSMLWRSLRLYVPLAASGWCRRSGWPLVFLIGHVAEPKQDGALGLSRVLPQLRLRGFGDRALQPVGAKGDTARTMAPRRASPSQIQFLTGAFKCRAATVLVWLFVLADDRPFFEIFLACFT